MLATTTTTPFEPRAIPPIAAISSPGYVDPIRVVAKQALLPLLIIPDPQGASWRSHGDGGNMAVLTQKSEAIIRGASLSAADFLRPGRVAQVGLDAGRKGL